MMMIIGGAGGGRRDTPCGSLPLCRPRDVVQVLDASRGRPPLLPPARAHTHKEFEANKKSIKKSRSSDDIQTFSVSKKKKQQEEMQNAPLKMSGLDE